MIKIVNIDYKGNDIYAMHPDGTISSYSFGDLEFPYAYFEEKPPSDGLIVSAVKKRIKVLRQSGIEEKDMWKVEVRQPFAIKRLASEAKGLTTEADIIYLERRLGADGIIEWARGDNYAYVDIEADKKGITLIGVIAYIGGKWNDYVYFTTPEEFLKYLKDNKISMLIAWNGYGYDFKVLDKYLKKDLYYSLILKIDAMDLHSRFAPRRTGAALNVVAKNLGIGEKLEYNFSTGDFEGLKAYNKQDILLMKNIVEIEGLLDLAYELSELTGLPPTKLHQSWIVENIIMKNKDKYGVYLETNKWGDNDFEYSGAYVLTAEVGLYENVAVLDINSLYPNIIVNNDWDGEGKDVYKLIQSMIGEFITKKNEYRAKYKQTGDVKDKIKSDTYKILANGSYGLFGLRNWRYANRDIAEFITTKGRETLQRLKATIENYGFNVIYGDTDSIFVQIPYSGVDNLVAAVNRRIYPYEVKLDKYFNRVIFVGSTGSIKKRYAGITPEGKIEIAGLEAVRNDWCDYAKEIQKEALKIILTVKKDEIFNKVNAFMYSVIKDMKNKKIDISKLLFVKSVDMEKEYKVETRQLKALKQMDIDSDLDVKFVEFWIGRGNKVIVKSDKVTPDMIDWNYYIEKQVKPIFERLINSLYNLKYKTVSNLDYGVKE